ncbi:MAG: c-type cytochrome [Acidobacteria bacterium]|nr:c-type cytochrome [Acidobacteriota bacterium]
MSHGYLILALSAIPLAAQHSDTALKNSFQSTDDRIRGGAFYRSQCASCHGIDGKGGASGPALDTGHFRHASNDEGLFRVITKGIAGTSMPGFSMNGREIWQIVAFIRSMNVDRAGSAVADSAQAGAQLFADLRCQNYHWFRGAGAPRGRDLTAIGSRLNGAELLTALIDPSAEVAPQYWQWRATTNTGETLRGSRLNEDTFSLQILDHIGKLRSVAKASLKEQTLERRSAMPSFKDKLSAQQLNDFVAFLQGAIQ